jgi:hypothetical protein
MHPLPPNTETQYVASVDASASAYPAIQPDFVPDSNIGHPSGVNNPGYGFQEMPSLSTTVAPVSPVIQASAAPLPSMNPILGPSYLPGIVDGQHVIDMMLFSPDFSRTLEHYHTQVAWALRGQLMELRSERHRCISTNPWPNSASMLSRRSLAEDDFARVPRLAEIAYALRIILSENYDSSLALYYYACELKWGSIFKF